MGRGLGADLLRGDSGRCRPGCRGRFWDGSVGSTSGKASCRNLEGLDSRPRPRPGPSIGLAPASAATASRGGGGASWPATAAYRLGATLAASQHRCAATEVRRGVGTVIRGCIPIRADA